MTKHVFLRLGKFEPSRFTDQKYYGQHQTSKAARHAIVAGATVAIGGAATGNLYY